MISNYYKYRIPITIDHTKIDEDLTHFPLKVVVSGTVASGIYEEIGENYKNISFTDDLGEELYCEIAQTYDENNLSYVYYVSRSDWVISSTVDTTIYLNYYGNQLHNDNYIGVSGETVTNNVWDNYFTNVYNFRETDILKEYSGRLQGSDEYTWYSDIYTKGIVYLYIYAWISDNDNYWIRVQARKISDGTWTTLYDAEGGQRVIINSVYSLEYDQISIYQHDEEGNDTQYVDYIIMGYTNEILDSTINENHGITYTNDFSKNSLYDYIEFDGADDYIQLPNKINTGPKTIQILCKPTESSHTAATDVIIAETNITGNSYGNFIRWQKDNNTFDWHLYKNVTAEYNLQISSSELIPNNWYDVCFTWDYTTISGGVKCYIDGVLDTQIAANSLESNPPSNNTRIGVDYYTSESRNFEGSISEIRISNIEREDYWVKASNYSTMNELNTIGEIEEVDKQKNTIEVEFSPSLINTELWLDASDNNTIILDTSNKVEQWSDKSGNDRHAIQTNSAYRPSVGDNCISFLSDVGHLTITNPLKTTQRIFMVIEPEDNQYILLTGNSPGAGYYILCARENEESHLYYRSGSPSHRLDSNETSWVYSSHSYIALKDRISILEINGADISNWSSVNISGYEGGWNYTGKIYEIIVIDVDDYEPESKVQTDMIEGYLAHKWGLTNNLPDNHPYKTTAPKLYDDSEFFYYFEGTVKNIQDVFIKRLIRLYRSDTGELVNSMESDNGRFFLTTDYTGDHFIICHDEENGIYNDLIYSKVTPGIMYTLTEEMIIFNKYRRIGLIFGYWQNKIDEEEITELEARKIIMIFD